MSESQTGQTRVDRILSALRNHPVLAIVIAAGVTVSSIGAVTDAVSRLGQQLGLWRGQETEEFYRALDFDLRVYEETLAPFADSARMFDTIFIQLTLPKASDQIAKMCEYQRSLAARGDHQMSRRLGNACYRQRQLSNAQAILTRGLDSPAGSLVFHGFAFAIVQAAHREIRDSVALMRREGSLPSR
jgi:hypothetical protein